MHNVTFFDCKVTPYVKANPNLRPDTLFYNILTYNRLQTQIPFYSDNVQKRLKTSSATGEFPALSFDLSLDLRL